MSVKVFALYLWGEIVLLFVESRRADKLLLKTGLFSLIKPLSHYWSGQQGVCTTMKFT